MAFLRPTAHKVWANPSVGTIRTPKLARHSTAHGRLPAPGSQQIDFCDPPPGPKPHLWTGGCGLYQTYRERARGIFSGGLPCPRETSWGGSGRSSRRLYHQDISNIQHHQKLTYLPYTSGGEKVDIKSSKAYLSMIKFAILLIVQCHYILWSVP